jgi:hypothetical protein
MIANPTGFWARESSGGDGSGLLSPTLGGSFAINEFSASASVDLS